ncbi:RagB/SusD family nutrient uptake outer membrane protein [Myroides odoratimimus]|uniref:RagB/SusD family nutrient uptake outer membrane protein n=1 Tax=Myroides odoratimimus TaxID=76832 RepID=UPI00310135AD
MIKYILSALTVLSISSCSLDVKNEQEISGDDIINTTQKATSVLAQAYKELPVNGSTFTLLSEDLQPTYLIEYNSNAKQHYTWNEIALKTLANSQWDSYYSAMVHLNALLNTEAHIRDKGADWDYIKGNALVLKAYIYFDLLQLYSTRYNPEAPGVLRKDELKIESNKRLTQSESIQYIERMLQEGISLMDSYAAQKIYFITTQAAKQLEIKIALYQGQYDKAEALATALLSESAPLPNTAETYASLWKYKDNSPTRQVYWAYDFRENPNHYLTTTTDGDIMQIHFLNKFEESDMRYTISQFFYDMKAQGTASSTRALLGKYKSDYNDKEEQRIILSRNTETYFLLLESLIEQNKIAQAITLYNDFKTSVHSETITDSPSQQVLRLLFRAEKQKEFIGEKTNYFDLKRWNTSIARYESDSNKKSNTIEATDFRWTWPIPTAEIRLNNNLVQNDGWQSIEL